MHLPLLSLLAPLVMGIAGPARAPRFDQVYQLKPSEGVFAYARISPDGKTLAYASEIKGREVTVVDLPTKKVLYTESGIDPYWSLDGRRMIYSGKGGVAIRHHDQGTITRNVAPASLGDYYSWAVRDGRNLILTIESNYYYLDGDKAQLPHGRVASCPSIGVGERPLISKDGKRITTFVRGKIVVRNLTDCNDVFDTGIPGAKADFSFDGRYIAFHAPKSRGGGYDIQVVDLKDRTVRTVTNMRGSSYFPSWTQDGRLCFRYDGPEYKGFMMASNVLDAPARALAAAGQTLPRRREWNDVFPETPQPAQQLAVVMVWGTWSAHSPIALTDLQRAGEWFAQRQLNVAVMTATDPGSRRSDIERLVRSNGINLPRIPLSHERLRLSEVNNQSPATLVFRDGVLVDRRLGAQSLSQLQDWIVTVAGGGN